MANIIKVATIEREAITQWKILKQKYQSNLNEILLQTKLLKRITSFQRMLLQCGSCMSYHQRVSCEFVSQRWCCQLVWIANLNKMTAMKFSNPPCRRELGRQKSAWDLLVHLHRILRLRHSRLLHDDTVCGVVTSNPLDTSKTIICKS